MQLNLKPVCVFKIIYTQLIIILSSFIQPSGLKVLQIIEFETVNYKRHI